MPEGLRNVGPTFCRMTKVARKDQVDRTILSYVNDIIIASKKRATYIFDMRKARLKLNPEKCIFGVTRGKVFGCLVSIKGIEANLDKIGAITQMQPP
jgi:hypothetical protein